MYIPALWSPLGMTLPQTMIIMVFQRYQIFSLEQMKDAIHTQYLTLEESLCDNILHPLLWQVCKRRSEVETKHIFSTYFIFIYLPEDILS